MKYAATVHIDGRWLSVGGFASAKDAAKWAAGFELGRALRTHGHQVGSHLSGDTFVSEAVDQADAENLLKGE